MKTIDDRESFYGYIRAIGSDPVEVGKCVIPRLWAEFEYCGETHRYRVPDSELFLLLSKYLVDGVEQMEYSDGWHINKLWIGKRNGKWWADLP